MNAIQSLSRIMFSTASGFEKARTVVCYFIVRSYTVAGMHVVALTQDAWIPQILYDVTFVSLSLAGTWCKINDECYTCTCIFLVGYDHRFFWLTEISCRSHQMLLSTDSDCLNTYVGKLLYRLHMSSACLFCGVGFNPRRHKQTDIIGL